MIRRVYSDLSTFKILEFHEGLNILLADKSPGATDQHTRNGAGKSSLLEIIHFLLGANCKRGESIFLLPALIEATFGLELDLAGNFARVERTGAKRSPLTVAGDFSQWPIAPTVKADTAKLSNDDWKVVLARLMFGLGETSGSWAPSFRSMLQYFVRRDRVGGMASPMKGSGKQAPVDQQVNISYLIGLEWSVPREWQNVREREKSLKELKKAMIGGALDGVVGTAAELKSELFAADERVRSLAKTLETFRVHEHYHDLEQEASALTRELASLHDDNLLDLRYAADLAASSVADVPPAPDDLERLYREAGIVLPDLVRRRFAEAQAFHDSVVRNRRAYLEAELQATHLRLQRRAQEIEVKDGRRAELMLLLESTGALEHFTALQGEFAKAKASAETLRQRHASALMLESSQTTLKIERARLSERLRRGYGEQETVLEEAILTYRKISAELYGEGKAGKLTIESTEDGPVFEAHMPAEKSKGVNNMRIFCFDMMLMLLSLRRGYSPGFIIHDSHLFDGVDERQVASALSVGGGLARENGFQYIVTMNSDAMPSTADFGDAVLDLRLTDATEDGGLFGFRFE